MWDKNQFQKAGDKRRVPKLAGIAHRDNARAMDPAEWVKSNLGFSADPTQEQVLRSDKQRGLLNCTRQWGKSTVTAAKAVHQAHEFPDTLTLVVSPSAR